MEKCFCHFNGYKVKDADARRMIEEERTAREKAVADAKQAAERATIAAAEAAQYAGNMGDVFDLEFSPGGLNFANGAEDNSEDTASRSIRSGFIPILNGFIGVIAPDGVQIGLFFFNSNMEYVRNEEYRGGSPCVLTHLEEKYVRVMAYYSSGTVSPDADTIVVYAQRTVPYAVRYDIQSLTTEEQAQARKNIGAAEGVIISESPNISENATASTTSTGMLNTSCGWFGEVKAGETYTFSADFHKPADAGTKNIGVRVYDQKTGGSVVQEKTVAYSVVPVDEYKRISCTFVATSDGYVSLNGNFNTLDDVFKSYEIATNIQLEKGNTPTVYAPFGSKVMADAEYTKKMYSRVEEAEKNISKIEEDISGIKNNQKLGFVSHVKSIAHQGASGYGYPQNTVENVAACAKDGWEMVEVDVIWTADNVPVISHDDTRTIYGTSETAKITESTYADLAAKQFFADANIRLSTLYEVIDVCKLYGAKVCIEFKAAYPNLAQREDLISYLKKRSMLRNCVWVCFNFDPLRQIIALDPAADVMLCTSEKKDVTWLETETRIPQIVRDNGVAILAFSNGALTGTENVDEYLVPFRNAGFKIGVFTLDDANQIKTYSLYADYITSNKYKVEDALKQ